MHIPTSLYVMKYLGKQHKHFLPFFWGGDHLTAQLTLIAFLQRSFPLPKDHPEYDIKQSDGKAPMMLKLWLIQGTPSLPLLPGSLWPGMDPIYGSNFNLFKLKKWHMLNWIVRNRTVWSFNCVLTNDWYLIKLFVIHINTWNHLNFLTC